MKEIENWKELKKDNPFRVPDGYFERFEDRMMARIAAESKQSGKHVTMVWVRWISGIAAVFLIGIIGFQQLYLKPQKSLTELDAMYRVIEYYAQDMDEASFASLMAENEALRQDDNRDAEVNLLEWMDVDDMTLIDAMMKVADK